MFGFLFFRLSIFSLMLTLPFFPKAEREVHNVSYPIPAHIEEYESIRVLIKKANEKVSFSSEGVYEVFSEDGKLLRKDKKLPEAEVWVSEQGIHFGNKVIQTNHLFVRGESLGIKVGKRAYLNTIEIFKKSSTDFLLINHIDLEDYLKGVIPFEANPKWSIETLKAQSIAARSFAFFKMIEKRKKDYDVGAGVLSQVYAGKNIHHQKTDAAVDQTRGQILTYRGEVFPGYYHSTSGGVTTRADLVWPVKSHPALQGVICEFCHKSKHYSWKNSFPLSEIEEKVRKKGGLGIRNLREVKFKDMDPSGRFHLVLLIGENGRFEADVNEFRIWIGASEMKSTLITRYYLNAEKNQLIMFGRGWGHGVGMDQYGAKYMGELGYTHEQILKYFYPGSKINKVRT